MVALPTARMDGQGGFAGAILSALCRLAQQFALVATVVTLVVLGMMETSQACSGIDAPRPGAQTTNIPPEATKAALLEAVQPVIASWDIDVSAKKHCTGNCSSQCHHCKGAASCCPACTVGLISTEGSITHDLNLPFVACRDAPLSSVESDTQFRPPRITL